MGNFHRFVDPTYNLFGGESFPAAPGGTGAIGTHTYDRINVTSGGVGGGGSSNVDGQKSTGDTKYTYFVAFGENATSRNTNRGLKALAENTDVLDDLMRTSRPKVSSVSSAGLNSDEFQLTGDVYVGDSGSVSMESLISFYEVVSGRKTSPEVGGSLVTATDLLDGPGGSTVLGSGWYTDPVIKFSAPLPNTSNYVFYYNVRTSTARAIETERHVFSNSTNWLQEAVERYFLDTHGLNERYRRSTKRASSWSWDTPGDGATIERDGKALTLIPDPQDWTVFEYHDPFLANVVGGLSSSATQSIIQRVRSGDMGFVQLGMWRVTESSSEEFSTYNRQLSSFTALNVLNPRSSSFGGTPTYTYIQQNTAAVLNAGNADPDAVSVSAPYYFRNGASFNSAIVLGYTLLLIVRHSGASETYVINEILSNTSVRVVTPGGATPAFPADEDVAVSIVQPLFTAGGAMTDAAEDPNWGPLTVMFPPFNANDNGQYDAEMPPCRFIAPAVLPTAKLCLAFGEIDPFTHLVSDKLKLYADGTVDSSRSITKAERATRTYVNVNGTSTFQWNPKYHGSYVVFRFTVNDSSLVIDMDVGYTPSDGDYFHFEFEPTTTTRGCTVTWGDSRYYEDINTLDLVMYNGVYFQTASGYYNANRNKFVSTLSATPEATIREKLGTLREQRTYFNPPLDTGNGDDLGTLFVGQVGSAANYFIAHRGGSQLYRSVDGRSPWSLCDVGSLSGAMNTHTVRDMAGNVGTIVLVTAISAGTIESGLVYYSTNAGLSWSVGPDIAAQEGGLKKVTYASGEYWALASGVSPANPVYHGTTGALWAAATITAGDYLWELDSDGSTVVFVGNNGGGDGVIYTNATTPALALRQTTTGNELTSVVYMSYFNRWIAMGDDGSEVWTSDDSITWTSRSTTGMGSTRHVRSIVALGPILVATTVLSSWDGTERRYSLYLSGDCGRTWRQTPNTYVGTAMSSDNVAPEFAFMMPDAADERFIFIPWNSAVDNDAGYEGPWLSGKLGLF
jgi:hypothetical protein